MLDFWRVADIVPGQRLLLHAQMRLPGEAILEFSVEPQPSGSRLTQTARFRPRGLAGVLYWMAVTPLHGIVFQSMLQGIRHRAESSESPELASA